MIVRGVVIGGKKLGRKLGFPTANIAVNEGVVAADGVYAAAVELDGRRHGAMANLGVRPTFSGKGKAEASGGVRGHVCDGQSSAGGLWCVSPCVGVCAANRTNGLSAKAHKISERILEVYIFDFDGDLYDHEIEVELLHFVRPEQRFESTEALRAEIEKDEIEIKNILKNEHKL